MLIDRKIYKGLLIGVILGTSGCLDSGGSSSGSSSDSNEEPDGSPQYTADLSVFGPHPETSLKMSVAEPRFVELSIVERAKVGSCFEASVSNMDFTAAAAELTLDSYARSSNEPRTVPFEQAADEVFYDQIARNAGPDWPRGGWGNGMAEALGVHVSFSYWKEVYEAHQPDPEASGEGMRSVDRKIREEVWQTCINRIPTECFETGEAGADCLNYVIRPESLPHYDAVSDLYSRADALKK